MSDGAIPCTRGLTWMWCVSERTAGRTTPVMDAPSRKANLLCMGSGGRFLHSTGGRELNAKQSPTHSACHFCIPFVPSEAEPMILRTNTAGVRAWCQYCATIHVRFPGPRNEKDQPIRYMCAIVSWPPTGKSNNAVRSLILYLGERESSVNSLKAADSSG